MARQTSVLEWRGRARAELAEPSPQERSVRGPVAVPQMLRELVEYPRRYESRREVKVDRWRYHLPHERPQNPEAILRSEYSIDGVHAQRKVALHNQARQ
jgi:hypothetical protein